MYAGHKAQASEQFVLGKQRRPEPRDCVIRLSASCFALLRGFHLPGLFPTSLSSLVTVLFSLNVLRTEGFYQRKAGVCVLPLHWLTWNLPIVSPALRAGFPLSCFLRLPQPLFKGFKRCNWKGGHCQGNGFTKGLLLIRFLKYLPRSSPSVTERNIRAPHVAGLQALAPTLS